MTGGDARRTVKCPPIMQVPTWKHRAGSPNIVRSSPSAGSKHPAKDAHTRSSYAVRPSNVSTPRVAAGRRSLDTVKRGSISPYTGPIGADSPHQRATHRRAGEPGTFNTATLLMPNTRANFQAHVSTASTRHRWGIVRAAGTDIGQHE